MADLFQVGVLSGSGSKDLTVADHDGALGPGTPSNYVTGDLRRKYNFGDRVSELCQHKIHFFGSYQKQLRNLQMTLPSNGQRNALHGINVTLM